MNYLITGSSGFLGKWLIHQLVNQFPQDRIYALSRRADMRDGVIPLVCDLLKTDEVKNAVRTASPDVVFHLAGNSRASGQSNLADQFESNYLMTQWLLQALEAVGKPIKLFLASSVHVYGNQKDEVIETNALSPESPYGFSKYLAELAAQKFAERNPSSKVVVGRLYSCIGPGQDTGFVISDFCEKLSKIKSQHDIFKTGPLDGIRAFMDVRDVANIIEALIQQSPLRPSYEVFNIASENYYSIREMLRILLDVSGKKPVLESHHETASNSFQGMRINTDRLQKRLKPHFRPIRETLEATWKAQTEALEAR